MAELATLARPYADAVFKLAKESEDFDNWSANLVFFAQIVQDPLMANIVANPRIDKVTLTKILLDLCDTHVNEVGKNLIRLLVDNDKVRVIPHIATQFEQLKANYQGYVKVEIISTYAVKPPQQQEIEAILRRRLGKAVDIKITVDRALTGGWLIKVGDQVIDLSIRGRLQQLASACEIVCRSV